MANEPIDAKVCFDRDFEDEDEKELCADHEAVESTIPEHSQEIFEQDLDVLMNTLRQFSIKHQNKIELTLILKEFNEQVPKIYVPNHLYDTAVLVTSAYNNLRYSILQGLKVDH